MSYPLNQVNTCTKYPYTIISYMKTTTLLSRLHLIIEELRYIEREFPAQLMSTYFYVMSHNGCYQQDMHEPLSMTSSSLTRNLQYLGCKHRSGKTGLFLVSRERCSKNYKKHRCYLSPKGLILAKKIQARLEGKKPT